MRRDKASWTFTGRYTKDAIKRLSAFLPAGFNLTASDILAFQNLCAYETASIGSSAFCTLFTEQEWKDYEYNLDLQFYGDYGFGSPTGRAQGIGYLLELEARLRSKLIHTSDTSINSTYDNNPKTFPLHQPLYLDMSHDDIIHSVITALNMTYFKFGPDGLPGDVDHAVTPRTFHLNQVAPYGARLISEIWKCPHGTDFDNLEPAVYKNPHLPQNNGTTDYIRFVLNNAPLTLEGVPGCEEGRNGFCEVSKFLKGVPVLKKAAHYQFACFGKYPKGKQVGDGYPELR